MRSTQAVQFRDILMIGSLALLCFLPFLGAAPLFDWDEINFAESAREMIVSGNYFQVQINFEPFWEKPPLFIWMQVLSMKMFGITAFAARFPNVIVGVCTLIALYIQGARFRGRRFGLITACFYFISILPFLYFKSGIIDPCFNLLIFIGLMQIIRFEIAELGNKPQFAPYLAGIWIGLATLTKGPVALLVLCLVYFSWKMIWDRKKIPWLALLKFTAVYLLVILSWFGSIVLFSKDGLETVGKFIVYQAELFSQAVAGHEQPFFYHFLVFLLGCFPLSAFAFRGMGMKDLNREDKILRNFMLIWFWVVLILFSIVRTKIVHYSSLLYFPGAFLAAFYLDRLWTENKRPKWDTFTIYGIGFVLFGVATLSINYLASHAMALQQLANNSFAKAALGTNVSWTGWEFLPGAVFVIAGLGGIFFLVRKNYRAFFMTFVISMPLFINGLNAMVLPRIADYSQNTAIQFYQEKVNEDAYVMVEGFKSYAQYFYGAVKPFPHPEIPVELRGKWMVGGPVDKKVYMVSRIDKCEMFDRWFGNFTRMKERNGFVFYVKELPPNPKP